MNIHPNQKIPLEAREKNEKKLCCNCWFRFHSEPLPGVPCVLSATAMASQEVDQLERPVGPVGSFLTVTRSDDNSVKGWSSLEDLEYKKLTEV